MATTRFSAFSILSGGALDLTAKPARVVAAIPFEHCCAFVIPANSTRFDFCFKLSYAGIGDIGLFHVLVNEKIRLALVGVQSAEELDVLKKATITVKDSQVAARRVVAFNDRLFSVHISRLEAASYEDATRNIYQSLQPFGDILDITFSRTGKVTDACANVIFNLRNDERLPSQLKIGKNMATISSNNIIEDSCKV